MEKQEITLTMLEKQYQVIQQRMRTAQKYTQQDNTGTDGFYAARGFSAACNLIQAEIEKYDEMVKKFQSQQFEQNCAEADCQIPDHAKKLSKTNDETFVKSRYHRPDETTFEFSTHNETGFQKLLAQQSIEHERIEKDVH